MIQVNSISKNSLGILFQNGSCQIRPDLKEGTYELIDELYEITEEGGGSLPCKKVFDTFGIPLSPDQQKEIEARGDVVFDPKDKEFINKGKKVKLEIEGVTVHIPEEVSGDYVSNEDSFKFHFSPRHTIKACQGFFCINTENIDGNRKGINLDMQGTLFDSCILFEPQRS